MCFQVPTRIWGIRMRRSPGFFLNTIIFSFVGRNPQLANDETVVNAENVGRSMPFFLSTSPALGTVLMEIDIKVKPIVGLTEDNTEPHKPGVECSFLSVSLDNPKFFSQFLH